MIDLGNLKNLPQHPKTISFKLLRIGNHLGTSPPTPSPGPCGIPGLIGIGIGIGIDRDPGLFWIPIPIPENFFQNRDRDQNRDLPFSSQLAKHVHIMSIYGNFLPVAGTLGNFR